MKDFEIIKNLKSDNRFLLEEAFEAMYSTYNALLIFISMRIVGNKNDACDIVSDVFLSVFKVRQDLMDNKNLKYYLIQATKNKSINFKLKQAKLNIDKSKDVLECPGSYENSKINDYFKELKKYLNEEELDIVLSHVIMDETFEVISKRYHTSLFSIAGKYRRSIKKLKKYIRKEDFYE